MPENKRRLYVALVKLLDIYNRFDPSQDGSKELLDLSHRFLVTFDDLDAVKNFVWCIERVLNESRT